MRQLRFGSYSTAATLAGTPSLMRRKSTTRYWRLWPPPLWGGGLPPGVVAATRGRAGLEQRALGRGLGDLGEVRDGLETATGAGGLALAERHRSIPRRGRSSRRRPA